MNDTESPALTPDQRIERWKQTLDPRVLWPHSSREDRVAGYRDIVQATASVLAGRPAVLPAATAPAIHATGIAAFVSGMGPLLGWWVERGVLQANPATAALLAAHLAEGRRRAALMGDRLVSLNHALNRQHIIPAILKGTYTTRRYFEEPGLRSTSDIDLLVKPGEMAPARQVMQAHGFALLATHTMPRREDWGPPGQVVQSLEMTHAENPWAVDLHSTLDRAYFPGLVAGFGIPRDEQMASWTGSFGQANVLRHPLQAAYLATHAGADYPDVQLARIVELIFVLRQDATGPTWWKDLGEFLARAGMRRFAWPGFALAARLAPESVDATFLEQLAREVTSRMRRTLAEVASVPPRHFPRQSLDLRLAWAKGPRQVMSNMLEWVYPTGPAVSGPSRIRIWRRRLGLLLSGRVGWSSGNGKHS